MAQPPTLKYNLELRPVTTEPPPVPTQPAGDGPRNYTLDVWARLLPGTLQAEIEAIRVAIATHGAPIPPAVAALTAPPYALLVRVTFDGRHGRIYTADGVPLDYLRGWEVGHDAHEGRCHVRLIWVQPWGAGAHSSSTSVLQWATFVLTDFAKLGLMPTLEEPI